MTIILSISSLSNLQTLLIDNNVRKYKKKTGITKKELKDLCLRIMKLNNDEILKAYKSPMRNSSYREIKDEKELISKIIEKEYFRRRIRGIYDTSKEPYPKELKIYK